MVAFRNLLALIIYALLASAIYSQTSSPATRTSQIEAEQRAKAAQITPDLPGKAERIFNRAGDMADRFFGSRPGFQPVIGNLVTGSGFAAGVGYFRPDLANGDIVFRSSARVSIHKYELLDAELELPHLPAGTFLSFSGAYRNYPTLQYYGSGPRTLKSARSDYRLEDTAANVVAGWRAGRHLRMGATAGYLAVNVGPGQDDRFVSSDKKFTEAQAPGIQFQSDYLRVGPYVQYDNRDHPGDPHSGGNYLASYVYYSDIRLDTGDHQKLSAEAQQYIPFLNEKRVIALRAKTQLSYHNSNQVVPFYLQSVLGGSDDLRGFRPFRFYDDNLLVMNAEYRWEIMSGFDMALFGDAGKVFHRHAELNLADLETSGGFGLRFKSREAVFMRWDVGFSREGFQVWIKFNNVF